MGGKAAIALRIVEEAIKGINDPPAFIDGPTDRGEDILISFATILSRFNRFFAVDHEPRHGDGGLPSRRNPDHLPADNDDLLVIGGRSRSAFPSGVDRSFKGNPVDLDRRSESFGTSIHVSPALLANSAGPFIQRRKSTSLMNRKSIGRTEVQNGESASEESIVKEVEFTTRAFIDERTPARRRSREAQGSGRSVCN